MPLLERQAFGDELDVWDTLSAKCTKKFQTFANYSSKRASHVEYADEI